MAEATDKRQDEQILGWDFDYGSTFNQYKKGGM